MVAAYSANLLRSITMRLSRHYGSLERSPEGTRAALPIKQSPGEKKPAMAAGEFMRLL